MSSNDHSCDGLPLVIAVTPEVVFDLAEKNAELRKGDRYGHRCADLTGGGRELQPGVAFEPIRRLLALNSSDKPRIVEVVMLSGRPSSDALRIFQELERLGLPIFAASFTSGRPLAPYLRAWKADMFLSTEAVDVRAALSLGIAAAKFSGGASCIRPSEGDGIHVIFDADGVILNSDSDKVFRRDGLKSFEDHERRNARVPIAPGPFGGKLLGKLVEIRGLAMSAGIGSPVRFSVVTAREAPAHERLMRSLLLWGTLPDEIHFVGHREKAPFLSAASAQLYFDDRIEHIVAAQRVTAAGLARADGPACSCDWRRAPPPVRRR